MHTSTLSELAQALEAGETTSEALTRETLERIQAHDGRYNSFITVAEERALEQARAADQARADGRAGPLTGIPFAHKDIFCTEDLRTTCGSRMLENFAPPYNSTVAQKLDDAGAVCVGKANMDEFAMGSSNETSYFGPVTNPWGDGLVPGGSSGGSAAAVAARLVPAATATDTGGSIRQPAALCGLTGLKPTYGRISRYGIIAFASSLDQAGTLTRDARDAALMLNTMAGFDPKDSTSLDREVPDYSASLENDLSGLRIGLPKEYFSDDLSP
ncbi:MAG: amidase, partial [Halospina sp.]